MAEPTRPRRRRGPKPAWSLVPLFVVLLLALVGIAVAGWVHGLKQRELEVDSEVDSEAADETPATPAEDPFAGVPEEIPRGASAFDAVPARPSPPTAAQGLEADPLWRAALEVAYEGEVLAAEALAAKQREDYGTYNTKGSAAKEAFDRAIEMTAEWELALIDEHGDGDLQVRKILRTRSGWFDQTRVFRKTTAGD